MERKDPLPLSAKAGGLAFSGGVFFYLIVMLVGSAIISLFGLSGYEVEKYIGYAESPLAILTVALITFLYARQPARKVIPVRCNIKYCLIAVLIIFGVLFSLSWANDYLIRLIELLGYTRRQSTVPSVSGFNIIPALIFVALIPAVAEEVFFRGIILSNAKSGLGSVAAIFATGFLFSLYHGSVEQTIYQFICGCLFAFLAVRSGSILPSTIAHFLNNAVILILYACGAIDGVSGNLIASAPVQIAIMVISALSLFVGVLWLILDKSPLQKGEKGAAGKFFLYASLGIAVMSLFWILGLFYV